MFGCASGEELDIRVLGTRPGRTTALVSNGGCKVNYALLQRRLPICVVQNELNHVFDLLNCEMVYGSLSRVWSILQIPRFDVLNANTERLVDTYGGLGERNASLCLSPATEGNRK